MSAYRSVVVAFVVEAASGADAECAVKALLPAQPDEEPGAVESWTILRDEPGRDGRTRDRTMLDDIFAALDGEEWNADTTADIGQVFTDNGWTIHAPGYNDEEE